MKQAINRLSELDILRGIAIFLVVFGHITHIAELRNYIWGFHIPIFFFISGLLFKPDKYNSFNDFLRNKIRKKQNKKSRHSLYYLLFSYTLLLHPDRITCSRWSFKLQIASRHVLWQLL